MKATIQISFQLYLTDQLLTTTSPSSLLLLKKKSSISQLLDNNKKKQTHLVHYLIIIIIIIIIMGKDELKKKRRDEQKDENDVERRKRKRKKDSSYNKKDKEDRRKSSSKSSSSSKKRSRRKSEKSSKKKKRKKYYSSSDSSSSSSDSESSSSSSSSSSESEDESVKKQSKKKSSESSNKKRKVVNKRLLEKLAARGETLEEREQRRAERRAARITAQFGYTATDNPFNDPNIADTFTWKKKTEVVTTASTKSNVAAAMDKKSRKDQQEKTFAEIEKVRKRRKDYEEQKEEMERIRADESRMKELEKYDEWAQKEEEFHLQQQRQRSAIRLIEGREKPIDVLAKNLLMFGFSDEDKQNRASVKYKEKYNALEEMESLEAELEEPHVLINHLKLNELEELIVDIEAFRTLEKDATDNGKDDTIVRYWNFLHLITKAEIKLIKDHDAGLKDDNVSKDIQKMFEGQNKISLESMKEEVEGKIKRCLGNGGRPVFDEKDGGVIDLPYWQTVLDQLLIHLAKTELSEMHSKMLVSQLEKLQLKKEELEKKQQSGESTSSAAQASKKEEEEDANAASRPKDVAADFGNLEEELGLTNEIDVGDGNYEWNEKYRPRKPRYFNRVRTGYDWNKYNQTHYDHDNPPPKIVQGYKFNIFYPDLFDKTITPKYTLEPTDSPEFCIIRFSCGPPYEDIAFKIINRQWNKSRKRGFRCTFERGVLSLYFNFATHWYRR